MNFDRLRRDLNSLFFDPFFGFDDPRREFDELRRHAMDIFDTHRLELDSGDEAAKDDEEKDESKALVPKEQKTGSAIVKTRQTRWIPRCDAEETKDSFIIKAELPGIEKDNIHVEFDDTTNVLTLSGERNTQNEEKKETKEGKYHFIERASGKFYRSFKLPDACRKRADEIHASAKEGILEIVCPKEEEEKQDKKLRKISVN